MKIRTILFILLFTNLLYSQGNGLYEFQNEKGKYGFIDKNGKIIIKPNYSFVMKFSDGLAFVSSETSQRGYKWICIDTLGNKVFDIGNDFPEEKFSEGFAIISDLNDLWFINKKGEKVFNKTWKDKRGNFKNGIAIVSDVKFKDYYYINSKGVKLDYLPSGNICVFDEGYALVFNKSYSIIDSLGNKVYENFELFGGFNDDLIKIRRNDKWGFIDKKGKVIIDFLYEEDRRKEFDEILKLNADSLDALPKANLRNIGLFNDGLVKFQKNGLWGFLNKNNEVIIEPKFKKVTEFSEGVAGVSIDGKKWGFIDKKSNFIIEPKFYLTDCFQNGICAVRINYQEFEYANDWMYDAIINSKGEIIREIEMHCFMGFENDLIRYYGGGHFSGGVHYLNKKGEIVIPKE